MIKLIVIARCIPEDVYLRSLEQQAPVFSGEKKFSVVVRDPESWYIGRLAIEIKNRYESLYKRPFGQIKYLKDADEDCDLDPELSVADLLVDEGKAARDGADQKRIVKVIQEQGRAVRQGSVIPDLTPTHYQPPTRPPVPKFPVAEKRTTEDLQSPDSRPSKRPRLDQIERDGLDDVVNSIEGNAINGNLNHLSIEPKQESPELARTWVRTGPATRDELELLPEAPANFQQRGPKTGLPVSAPARKQSPEIRETSAPAAESQQPYRTPGPVREREPLANRFARQHSLANAETPVTPPASGHNVHTPGGQAVSMLNGMKSASPALRQPASSSANKFRKTKKDIYDFEESDIDDTQMSPRSKALRTKITPKLVPTHSKGSADAATKSARSTASTRESETSNAMDNDSNKENQKEASNPYDPLPRSRYQRQDTAAVRAQDTGSPSWARDGFSQLPPKLSAPTQCPRKSSGSLSAEGSSALGADETSSVQGDGTIGRRRRLRKSRMYRISSGSFSTSKDSSVTSSTSGAANSDASKQQDEAGQSNAAANTTAVTHDDDGEDDLDSPGAQLEQSLRQSSPTKEKSAEVKAPTPAKQSSSQSAFESAKPSKPKKRVRAKEDQDDEAEIERAPESVSDSQEVVPPLRVAKRLTNTSKQAAPSTSSKAPTAELRCYTCWTKSCRCDNKEPKCSHCEKYGKNCQIYALTKGEAEKEKADRKAGTSQAPKPSTKPASESTAKQSKSRLSEEIVAATDSDEESEVEGREKTIEPWGKEEIGQHGSLPPAKKAEEKKPIAKLPKEGASAPVEDKRDAEENAPEERVRTGTTVGAAVPMQNAGQYLHVPKDRHATRERSLESHAPSIVLPPGMTQEEYDRLVTKRKGMTDLQRKEQKLHAKKLDMQKEKEATPLVPRSQSSQKPAETTRKETPSVKSGDKAPTSSRSDSKSSQPPAAQPSKIPASVVLSTPVAAAPQHAQSAPPKQRSATTNREGQSTKADKKKLTQHASLATTASSLDSKKHQNPPFRPPQAQLRKSLLSSASAAALSPTVSLTNSRSLAQVREALKSRSNAGSSASTPQPASVAAKIAASKGSGVAQQKKGFSLSDDDDEEEEEMTDSDSESGSATDGKGHGEKPEIVHATEKMVNDRGLGGVIVRQRTPSETGTEDSDVDDDDLEL